jgi:hypothetical protein
MYFLYDKDGNQTKKNHLIDYHDALRTGKFFADPPGMPEPVKPAKLPEGETIEGIKADVNEEAQPKPKRLHRG